MKYLKGYKLFNENSSTYEDIFYKNLSPKEVKAIKGEMPDDIYNDFLSHVDIFKDFDDNFVIASKDYNYFDNRCEYLEQDFYTMITDYLSKMVDIMKSVNNIYQSYVPNMISDIKNKTIDSKLVELIFIKKIHDSKKRDILQISDLDYNIFSAIKNGFKPSSNEFYDEVLLFGIKKNSYELVEFITSSNNIILSGDAPFVGVAAQYFWNDHTYKTMDILLDSKNKNIKVSDLDINTACLSLSFNYLKDYNIIKKMLKKCPRITDSEGNCEALNTLFEKRYMMEEQVEDGELPESFISEDSYIGKTIRIIQLKANLER